MIQTRVPNSAYPEEFGTRVGQLLLGSTENKFPITRVPTSSHRVELGTRI